MPYAGKLDALMDHAPEFAASHSVSEQFIRLVWDIFFVSRNRGLSLATHFPWITTEQPDTWYVLGHQGQMLTSGLVVREQVVDGLKVGTVGLVCVRESCRGQGISNQLLRLTVGEAMRRSIDVLRLWTGKPNVYLKHGFTPADDGLFGWVERSDSPHPNAGPGPNPREAWPPASESMLRGLPPFAASAWSANAGNAGRLVVIEDGSGPIVAEWQGKDDAVLNLMSQHLPLRFRLNAFDGQSLLVSMAQRGWRPSLERTGLQMVRQISQERSAAAWASMLRTCVIERI